MSACVAIMMLLVFLFVLIYSLHVMYTEHEDHALRKMARQRKELDDDAVKVALDESIVRTRAACSAKSCENMGENGLCRLACICIDDNGHCRMARRKKEIVE